MADIGKLSTLLDDPAVRGLIYGPAQVGSALPPVAPGPTRLRAVVLHLTDTTRPGGTEAGCPAAPRTRR